MKLDVVKSGPGNTSPEDADKQRKRDEDRISEFAHILETVDLDMSSVNLDEENLSKVDFNKLREGLFADMKAEMKNGGKARRD